MKNKLVYKRIFRLILPHGILVIVSILFALIHVFCNLYLPILTGQIIDYMIGPNQVNFPGISRLIVRFVIVLLIGGISSWLMTLCNNKTACRIVLDIRKQLFEHLQQVPVSYIDSHGHGDILSRMISDVERLSDGLLLGFSQLFTGTLTILGTLLFMLYTNGWITIAVVVLTPLSLFCATFISRKTYQHFAKQAKLQGELTTMINENISGVRILQAFCSEEQSTARFHELNEKYSTSNLKALFYSSTTNPATRFVNGLVYAAVGILGALLGVNGKLSIGTLSCFLSYANQYTKPFNEISGVATEFQNAVACASRIFEFLDVTADIDTDLTEDCSVTDMKGQVQVEHLSFSYDKTKKLLENISFHANVGDHIAIVGPTGCGKTTIINLLLRFYEPDQGQILYDGVSSTQIPKKHLRNNIGMVLQDTWLKSGTIAENISYGKKDATMDEIIDAAKQAHAHSFISRMEKGYDTYLSSDGTNLSAGQKQLICIARVMLSLPPILILDEATSSIDTRTEQKITRAFDTMMIGRTSFIVAHRLSTIQNADLILVMKDGNIIEQGSHEDLLSQHGFYYSMLHSR